MSKRDPFEKLVTLAAPARAWRSLEAFEDPAAAHDQAVAEFPEGAGDYAADRRSEEPIQILAIEDVAPRDESGIPNPSVGRRTFVTLTSAAAAAATAGCLRRPENQILPYSQAPEYLNPGVPSFYATVLEERGEALGVLVESHEGRPTKVEGNPQHPASEGSTSLHAQASVMDLYDADRLRGVKHRPNAQEQWDDTATFEAFDTALAELARSHESDRGARLRILTEPTISPTFARLVGAVERRFPAARIASWSPANDDNIFEGTRLAFGEPLRPVYRYDARESVIVSLDADFLGTEAGVVAATRRFARSRKLDTPAGTMNRLYVIESSHSLTGASADHRLAVAPDVVGQFLIAVADTLIREHHLELADVAASVATKAAAARALVPAPWVAAVAAELSAKRGSGMIVPGAQQPVWVHALAQVLNVALGNGNRTVRYVAMQERLENRRGETAPGASGAISTLGELVADLSAGRANTLVILGGNPVFDAPADLAFGAALGRVANVIHVTSAENETSEKAHWIVPRPHALESWGDARSMDGTVSVRQPLIAPLFGARSDIEILAALAGEADTRGYTQVRATRGTTDSPALFENDWRRLLHRGLVPTETPLVEPTPRTVEIARAVGASRAAVVPDRSHLCAVFQIDLKMFDGRHHNNPWLLELPDPMTRISWGSAAVISPRTARELSLRNGDMVRLSAPTGGDAGNGGGPITTPVWIMPGQPDFVVGLPFGWGRRVVGHYGAGHGHDVYPLRRSDSPWFLHGVSLAKTGESEWLVQTQEHHSMEGRPIAIDATLDEYRASPTFPQYRDTRRGRAGSPTPTVLPLWREREYTGHKWGLAIDLTSCTGCNACVVACQAENNTPTVGKEMVRRGREMHWLRIDRYFMGEDANAPAVSFQPLACQQCEEAPCENVCPVNATAHSPEGLNDMAYNRCIGTRYCMNNCPYKVRRFNYLNWHYSNDDEIPEIRRMQFNPNVSVRMRGVMEKCTYCVQRIQSTKIKKRVEGRPIADGDIVTACQQACPAQAITFGDLSDANSRVSRLQRMDRQYKLLAEIGTQPRTTFLAKIRNPNPVLEAATGTTAAAPGAAHAPAAAPHGGTHE